MSSTSNQYTGFGFRPPPPEVIEEPKGVTCKFCGRSGFEWKKRRSGSWKLVHMGTDEQHTCKEFNE
jgi:hypothetical protein